MARIRTIKPEFWSNHDLARDLTRDQRMFYVGLWNEADDDGRFVALPRKLLGAIFPYENDLTEQWVSDSLSLLCKTGRVVLYSVRRTPYGEIVAWRRHQRINRPTPSRIPASNHEDAVLTESLSESVNEHSMSRSTVEVGSRKQEVGSRNEEATPLSAPAESPLELTAQEEKPRKRKQPNDEMHSAVIDAYNETVRSMSSRFRPIECMSPSEQTLRKIDAAAKRVGPEFLTRWQRLCRWLPQDEHVSGRRRPPEGEDHWNWRADITFLLRPEKWERMDFLAREWTEQETRRLAEAEMQRKAREQRDAEYEQERQRERSAKPSLSERLAAVGINRDDYRSNYALIEELARREAAAKGATA